jgi:hypothetical protein
MQAAPCADSCPALCCADLRLPFACRFPKGLDAEIAAVRGSMKELSGLINSQQEGLRDFKEVRMTKHWARISLPARLYCCTSIAWRLTVAGLWGQHGTGLVHMHMQHITALKVERADPPRTSDHTLDTACLCAGGR